MFLFLLSPIKSCQDVHVFLLGILICSLMMLLSLYPANSNNNYYSYEGVFNLTLLYNTLLSQMDLSGIIEA